MKIWLENIKKPPDSSWIWCRDIETVRHLFDRDTHSVIDMSLDHNLEFNRTGGDLVNLAVNYNRWPIDKPEIRFHCVTRLRIMTNTTDMTKWEDEKGDQ